MRYCYFCKKQMYTSNYNIWRNGKNYHAHAKCINEKVKKELESKMNELESLKKFKKDFENNLKIANERLEKQERMLNATEKERLRLLKENQILQDKIDRQNVIESYIQEEAKKLYAKDKGDTE